MYDDGKDDGIIIQDAFDDCGCENDDYEEENDYYDDDD
jgi:hypothetical protein